MLRGWRGKLGRKTQPLSTLLKIDILLVHLSHKHHKDTETREKLFADLGIDHGVRRG